MERCAAVQIRTPEDHKGRWAEEFSQYREIRLELGCGKGRFTLRNRRSAEPDVFAARARKVPDAMVVAMERVVGRAYRTSAFSTGTPSSCPRCSPRVRFPAWYINFPDPWPKKKQFKRRLTAPEFLDKYRALLPEGGGRSGSRPTTGRFSTGRSNRSAAAAGRLPYAGGHAHDRLRKRASPRWALPIHRVVATRP